MSTNQDELEERLLKRAQTAIRNLLGQKDGRRDLSMSEMEELVGDLEIELRQGVMQDLIGEAQSKAMVVCLMCGGKLRSKGKKPKRVVTLRGEVEVERDYYHCAACGRGYFPPG